MNRVAKEATWPVVIVGGGPAGAVAARQLALAGQRVLLLDKAKFPRPKVCGGCLGGFTLSTLASVGLQHLPEQLGAVPLETIRLSTGQRSVVLPVGQRIALSRTSLDEALLNEAELAGATVWQQAIATVGRTEGDFRHVEVKLPDQSLSLKASLVVLAHGLTGRLPEDTDLQNKPQRRSHIGIGTMIANVGNLVPAGELVMHVGRHGYVGIVQTEANQLDVAAAIEPQRLTQHASAGEALAEMVDDAYQELATQFRKTKFIGTPPLTRQANRVGAERLALVGDAAGYVEPFTGEGIGWAMAGAVQLAELIAAAKLGEYQTVVPQRWQTEHNQSVRHRQTVCRWISRSLRSTVVRQIAMTGLQAIPWLARPVVRAIDRAAIAP